MRMASIIIGTITLTCIILAPFGCKPTTDAEVAPKGQPDANQQAQAIIAEAQAKADDIIAEAEALREEVKREKAIKEIENLDTRVRLLTARVEEAGKSELMLSRFTIEKAEMKLTEEEIPTITMTVKNGTNHPVLRAYFYGTFKAPFRDISYAEGEFNYRIPGGLEPGEVAEWTLENIPWISPADFPDDASTSTFEVEIMRIDDKHGAPILDRTHARADIDELERLQSNIAELKDLVPGYTPPPPPAEPEPLPDPAHTPPLLARKEVTGNVYAHEEIYHIDRECETMNGAIPSVTKAENARKRRMTPCKTCIGS